MKKLWYIRPVERVNSAESYLPELETLETEQRQPHIWPQKRQANTTGTTMATAFNSSTRISIGVKFVSVDIGIGH
jgi:hypothetical protein